MLVLTFTVNRSYPRYVGSLPFAGDMQAVVMVEGPLGRARDRLHNTVVHLDKLGVSHGALHCLLGLVETLRHCG